MRTNEERLAAMHKRAAEIEREDKNRKVLIMQGASVVAGLAAVIVLAFIMPGMAGSLPSMKNIERNERKYYTKKARFLQ